MKFDLEYQYQLYLQRVKLSESRMGHVQRQEMKRAFMGACGQILVLLGELSKLDEDMAIEKMQAMSDQVRNYFMKEAFTDFTNKPN